MIAKLILLIASRLNDEGRGHLIRRAREIRARGQGRGQK